MAKPKRTYFAMVPSRALDMSLTDAVLAILLLMCAALDEDGWCRYSIAGLAERRGVSRQAVQKQVDLLVDKGLVEKWKTPSSNGAKGPSKYRILYDWVTPKVASDATKVATLEVASERNLSSLSFKEDKEFVSDGENSRPAPKAKADPVGQRIAAAYVDEYRLRYGADPLDAGTAGRIGREAVAAGWAERDVIYAAKSVANDSFGAKVLMKHLHTNSTPQAEPEQWGYR